MSLHNYVNCTKSVPYDSNYCNTETAKSSAENARDDFRLNFNMSNEIDSNDELFDQDIDDNVFTVENLKPKK